LKLYGLVSFGHWIDLFLFVDKCVSFFKQERTLFNKNVLVYTLKKNAEQERRTRTQKKDTEQLLLSPLMVLNTIDMFLQQLA